MLGTHGRECLRTVLQAGGAVITVAEAATALACSRLTAAKCLARWQEQGWLRRVRRGVYVPVPLTAAPAEPVIDDPWVVVPSLFAPGYVGGASAAFHWGLTARPFPTVVVYTARAIRQTSQTVQGIPFTLRRVAPANLFGIQVVWQRRVSIPVSDLHRTLLDLLNDPALGGGIPEVAACLQAYLGHAEANPGTLVAYAERLGNGAVFKRLGFLAERGGAPPGLVAACAARLTQGNARLDPARLSPRLLRRWRLWLPERWAKPAPPSP